MVSRVINNFNRNKALEIAKIQMTGPNMTYKVIRVWTLLIIEKDDLTKLNLCMSGNVLITQNQNQYKKGSHAWKSEREFDKHFTYRVCIVFFFFFG